MSTGARVLVVVLVTATLTVAAGIGITAASIATSGTIAVDVQEHRGDRVSVKVPAGLVSLVLFLVPNHAIEHALDEVDRDAYREVESYLPAVRSAWRELDESPDFVLVEVDDGNEQVRVEKRDGRILVSVDSDDLDLDISFPLHTVERLLGKI